jgi:hypothetical protein
MLLYDVGAHDIDEFMSPRNNVMQVTRVWHPETIKTLLECVLWTKLRFSILLDVFKHDEISFSCQRHGFHKTVRQST